MPRAHARKPIRPGCATQPYYVKVESTFVPSRYVDAIGGCTRAGEAVTSLELTCRDRSGIISQPNVLVEMASTADEPMLSAIELGKDFRNPSENPRLACHAGVDSRSRRCRPEGFRTAS